MIERILKSGSSVTALAVALMVGTAMAQEAPAELEEIVVTSYRQGLAKGVDVKRNSPQFVDAIVAEDIGKLPDVNVAESLQRVSGVQIKRSLGEGTQVSIRGLTQNLTLINGRDIVDAAGRGGSGIDTLGTGSYGLLAQLPSEIIQRLDVTKLASASDVEGALGGTVNIISAKPLSAKDDVTAFSVEGMLNDRKSRGNYRGSLLLSHKFTDDFGALLNVSYSDRTIRDESAFSFSGYLPLTAAFDSGATANRLGTGGATITRDPNGDGTPGYYLADIRDTQIDDNRKRLGVNGSLQWRPTDSTEFWFDTLYSKQDITRDRYWLSTNLTTSGSAYTSLTFSPTETVIAGTLNTVVQGNTEYYTNDGTTLSSGVGGRWSGESLEVTGDLSYSRSKQYGLQTFLRASTKSNYPVTFEFRDVDVPQWSVAGLNMTDPSLFRFTNAFDNADQAVSENKAARLDASYSLDTGFLSALKTGVRFSKTDVAIDKWQTQLGINVSADTVPDSFEIKTLDILKGASGYKPLAYVSPVLFGGSKTLACQVTGTTCTPRVRAPLSSFETSEKDWAGYAQADIDTEFLGMPVRGNAGTRYVHTDFTAEGFRTTAGSASTFLPTTYGKKYDDFLPSVTLNAELTEDVVLRLGAAKVMARPNSADQNPGVTLDPIASLAVGAIPTGTAGNPQLDPFRAKQVDLSLEYYFKPASLLSLGLFRKDLATFIVSKGAFETFDNYQYLVRRPVNGTGGDINGIEVNFQDNFDFLPAPFDGFGMVANYSYIDSSTPFVSPRTGEQLPIPGLSKNNVNLILFYEKGDYGVRLAYNWRDTFMDSIAAGGDGVFFDTTQDLSLSTRWQFTPELSVDMQISNLLDSRVRQYGGVEDATKLYALNGRTYSVALRGKF